MVGQLRQWGSGVVCSCWACTAATPTLLLFSNQRRLEGAHASRPESHKLSSPFSFPSPSLSLAHAFSSPSLSLAQGRHYAWWWPATREVVTGDMARSEVVACSVALL
jgi:hypothetical protein